MAEPLQSPSGTFSDPDDASNYESIDDYRAGASSWLSTAVLVERWNAAHPGQRVTLHGDSAINDPASNSNALGTCGVTRAFAALQLIGGGFELFLGLGALLAPEPTGATKVLGAVVLLHGVDTMQASVQTILKCDRTATLTQQGATGLARMAHASPKTAETIGLVTDVGIGIGGSFAVGTLARLAPSAGTQLVHLTGADAAAAIRAQQTLGLAEKVTYAGPQSLAAARGWSIIARTGIPPSKATEVILLPSKANASFIVVQPMGPFSLWQRLNGTVFSAGTGMFNLSTGVFTRTGVATHQLGVYAVDSAIMATVRGAPPALDLMFSDQ
jgi:hypothetical protein